MRNELEEYMKIEQDKIKCKGRVYRYTKSAYVTNDGSFQQRESFKLLKRKSCKGCEKCMWEEKWIQESMSCSVVLPMLDKFENGDEAYYYLDAFTDYYGEFDVYSEGFKKVIDK